MTAATRALRTMVNFILSFVGLVRTVEVVWLRVVINGMVELMVRMRMMFEYCRRRVGC